MSQFPKNECETDDWDGSWYEAFHEDPVKKKNECLIREIRIMCGLLNKAFIALSKANTDENLRRKIGKCLCKMNEVINRD